MRHAASPVQNLPLPRDYFQCPELSHEEEERMIQIARMSCQRLIETTYSPNSEWATVSFKNGVRISKSTHPGLREDLSSTSDNQYAGASTQSNGNGSGSAMEGGTKLVRGTTTVSATIEEIALQFKVDRGQNLMKSRKDILDSMVLYNLVRPSGARPRDYVGVFWECVKSPLPFSQNRDFLYLECHEEFETPDGRRGWGYSMHSIKLACCPPLDSLKLVRATLYNSGFVFIETPKLGELECHYFLELDAKGSAPAIVSDIMARRKISALSHLNKVLQEQRLESETLLGDLELPVHHAKIECVLCYKRFQFFHRKYTCRKCGEVVCKSCQSTWELDLPGVGVRQICICTLCSANSRIAGSNAETMERMREVYVPDDDSMSESGNTMVTDISCSISQYFSAQEAQEAHPRYSTRPSDVVYSSNPRQPRRPVRPVNTTQTAPLPPSVLLDADYTARPPPPIYQVDANDDDIISLGSEERFSFHAKLKKNARNGAPPAVPEHQTIDNQREHQPHSPRRMSYDACADNLVHPETWTKSPPHPRIEIGSNKRFL